MEHKIAVIFCVIFLLICSETAVAKVYSKCDFVKKISGIFPADKLNDWSCLVQHESSFNSGKRGPINRNKSYDYGIFQINDKYWCKVGEAGGDCKIDCNSKIFFEILLNSFELILYYYFN